MKLTIEQKAKRYDEAIEIARKIKNGEPINVPNGTVIPDVIFPELKEDENDRIRRVIIEHFVGSHSCMFPYKGFTKEQIIDWLEKQGEQKSQGKSALEAIKEEKVDNANNILKFKEGEYVVDIDCGKVLRISEILSRGYLFENGYYLPFDTANREYRLWTIADAKDGDVVCYKDEISLYNHDIKNAAKEEITFGGFVYHCCYDGKRFITDSFYSLTEQDKTNIHPATKEQRDLLFQKMKESGYTWDSKKKEPIRI